MNEVYLGQSGDNEIRGFPLASLYYFGRPVEELSLDQQALLVGMVKGASIYNPWRNPKLALERRNLVLRLLQQQQIIDGELYEMLSARPLGVQPRGGVISPQPAFMQLVRQELQAKLGDKVKDLSGVKIFTTFDSVAQDAAEKAAVEGIPALKKQRKLSDLETAIVVVDRFSGEVRAMVGGSEPQFAGYNRAMQARRSIGSLAKPATYLTALSQPKIYRLNTWIADAPIALRQPNGQVWSPQNDDRRYSESGRVMLVDALTRSMNVPTVNLGMALGLPAVTETWIKLGVPKDQLHPVPAMLLGALNLTPIEVAQAFQTIASGGNRAPLSALRSVIAEDGKVLYQSFPQAERAVPAQAAYLTLWTMQQVVQRGTGRQLGAKYPNLHLAGKTGTTNNNVDTWFAGIDGSTVTITWVGRDNNQPTELSEDDWKVGYIENLNLDKKQMIPIKTICKNLNTNEDIPKQTITSGINSNGVLINVINLCEKDGVDISISQDYTEDYPYLPLVFPLKSSFTITSYVFENRNIDLGLSEEEAARTNYHSGWDFAAPLGTPFYSMCNGEIKNVVNTQYNDLIYSESGNATGNYVSVTCNNGFEIVYHHIKANSVPLMYRRGTPVREGILLGNVSTTGLSTGFHLHVGLKINGEQADVLEYVDFNYKR